MIRQFANSTKSLTGKLALFFTLVSVINCLVIYLVFLNALKWAQDEEGHKHIVLDSQTAIERYQSGETGKLQLDVLTDAYDDFTLVPQAYLDHIHGELSWLESFFDLLRGIHRKESLVPGGFEGLLHGDLIFLGRVETDSKSARMLLVNEFEIDGAIKPLILVSKIDEIELTSYEHAFILTVLGGIFAVLLAIFILILTRLSKRLISPVNRLSDQLDANKGDPDAVFTINHEAAIEFTQLTGQMNLYREEINELIKREQIFARYASHELRTPLAIVTGANELLQRGDNSDFQNKQLSRIQRASDQMSVMVDALLALVRYERCGGDVPVRKITQQELQSVFDDHICYITNKEIEFELSITGEPEVKAATEVISMIIGNLVRNALSATERGRIELRMGKRSISVLDEGSGLSEQPFEEGHGLGLLLVKDFCQRYGWQFSLTDREGKGCQARIEF
ncbi:HAMP domain-containing histidine kinase [Vibrio sp. JC009]|uniref:sensor histidine kinase n=1 Tax=Vibrio sp. JC009 TaxID=2912314 RepID=UPI0023AE87BA|nr:HAMP domain-containing sensor histidine kinase [Vibrio sp. JC009]WED24019.1 HAMP domain-containing histidine kinase [Vibrio sp. JC009]